MEGVIMVSGDMLGFLRQPNLRELILDLAQPAAKPAVNVIPVTALRADPKHLYLFTDRMGVVLVAQVQMVLQ